MEGLKNLTYELPSTNILNQVTLKHRYTHSMMENNKHMRLFFFHFIFFFLTYIQNVHALNANKKAPKMRSKMDKHTLKC